MKSKFPFRKGQKIQYIDVTDNDLYLETGLIYTVAEKMKLSRDGQQIMVLKEIAENYHTYAFSGKYLSKDFTISFRKI